MTPQQPTTGHPYGTRGVMQGGKSDCASKNAKGDDPDTIDVDMQGSIPPEEPRGPALGPATATNHVVGGTGEVESLSTTLDAKFLQTQVTGFLSETQRLHA